MKLTLLLIASFYLSVNIYGQDDKGRALFFGVNVGTKIANKNYALRYSGAYSHFGTTRTQLEHTLIDNEINYFTIKEKLGGIDFVVPIDAYPLRINYIPGIMVGVNMGYQISPNLQVSVDANINQLKIKSVYTIEVLDGGNQTSQEIYRTGELYAEETRFNGRFNFDYVGDGNKAKFLIGLSGLLGVWRIDEHTAIFDGYNMPLYTQHNLTPNNEDNVVRNSSWGAGINIGVDYRIRDNIVSQIVYQPYFAKTDYGYTESQRFLLQHDITVRFLWK